jgi:tRNA (guanine10-N2)-methyltransferase
VTEEYEEIDIQTMLCEGMELIANSLQDFGSWGRRVSEAFWLRSNSDHGLQLVTILKSTKDHYPPPTFDVDELKNVANSQHIPAHKDFREKYFQGFKAATG